ncbi:MAG: hypothetical protein ACYC09_14585 [Bacteroidota bacterium]
MKWMTILLLSLVGVCMGGVSLFGYTQQIELILWTIIALATAFFIARTTSHNIFVHGFLAGLGMGILNAAVQAVGFSLYAQYNEFAAAEIKNFSSGMSPRLFIMLSSLFIGGIYGSVIGALSLAAAKFHHPK